MSQGPIGSTSWRRDGEIMPALCIAQDAAAGVLLARDPLAC
ncbi:hypothetical protein [Blastococcus sp. SYSU DS0617]